MHQFFTDALVKFSIIILLHILDLFSRVRVRVRIMVSVRVRVMVTVRVRVRVRVQHPQLSRYPLRRSDARIGCVIFTG